MPPRPAWRSLPSTDNSRHRGLEPKPLLVPHIATRCRRRIIWDVLRRGSVTFWAEISLAGARTPYPLEPVNWRTRWMATRVALLGGCRARRTPDCRRIKRRYARMSAGIAEDRRMRHRRGQEYRSTHSVEQYQRGAGSITPRWPCDRIASTGCFFERQSLLRLAR